MKTETYNGWANVDTWLLNLWLSNDYKTYKHIKNNKELFIKRNKIELINSIIELSGCTDKINKTKVNIKEIKEAIKNL